MMCTVICCDLVVAFCEHAAEIRGLRSDKTFLVVELGPWFPDGALLFRGAV